MVELHPTDYVNDPLCVISKFTATMIDENNMSSADHFGQPRRDVV